MLLLSLGRVGHVTFLHVKGLWANEPWSLTFLLVIFVGFHVHILEGLLVICSSKSPHDVIDRSFIQVLLQMVEGMLGHISQSHVLMPPNTAHLRLELADEKLDGGGLPGTIRTDDSDARSHANRQSNVFDDVLFAGRVLECDTFHLQDFAAARFHTFKGTRHRENPLFVFVRELEVRAFFWISLYVFGKHFALLGFELAELTIMEIDDVCRHLIQELCVRRGCNDGAREIAEPVLDPLDVFHTKCAVGLSTMRMSALMICAQASCILNFHPPLYVVIGLFMSAAARTFIFLSLFLKPISPNFSMTSSFETGGSFL